MPEMKQECDLSPMDFVRHPVWIGVHGFDSGQPWYENSDEETFRPWPGTLPFDEATGVALVAATIELADGAVHAGFCRRVGDDWDSPIPSISASADSEPRSWSTMHGGSKLSVLLLQNPIIFINGRQFDFQLRVPRLRTRAIGDFYSAIGKSPAAVFPLRFVARSGLATGLASGTLDGFYSVPMSLPGQPKVKPEITVGEALDSEGAEPFTAGNSPAWPTTPEQTYSLTAEDFQRHPIWLRESVPESATPLNHQPRFVPWNGPAPVDLAHSNVRIPATFVLFDGTELSGFVAPVPENWADIAPPPTAIGKMRIQRKSSNALYGDCPWAIVERQQPCVFIEGRKVQFWCLSKDPEEANHDFQKTLRKRREDIFPIRFADRPGLATGITAGEINGFYKPVRVLGKPTRIVCY
jgi:hypothetical protein